MKFKKIAQEFIACGKEVANIINRKRDSLCYTSIAAYSVSPLLSNHSTLNELTVPAIYFLVLAAHRELTRAAFWKWSKIFDEPAIVFQKPLPIEKFKPMFSSVAVVSGMATLSGAIVCIFLPDVPSKGLQLTFAAGASSVACGMLAGGASGIINNYKMMWNWPEKRDGKRAREIPHLKKAAKALTDVFRSNRPKPPSQNSDPPKHDKH